VKVGDLVKTSMWGNGIVLEVLKARSPEFAVVMVERIVNDTCIRCISCKNIEVIHENR